ncbi:MAG: c-type cytochrome [Anaerolineae bacterium]|nr:c-type cytochrome [Anaerolineae bacterium]
MTTDDNLQIKQQSNYRWVIFTGLAALLITLNLALTFQLSEQTRVKVAASNILQTHIHKGASIFISYCAICHGGDGKGTDRAPILNDKLFLSSVSDDFLQHTISDGRPRTDMPAWGQEEGGPLTSQEIFQVVAFFRNWEKPVVDVGRTKTASGLPADSLAGGQETFIWYCAECHGDDGDLPSGSEDIVANSPERLRELTDDDIRQRILEGGLEESNEMPGLKGLLSVAEIEGLMKFIDTWQR